jgi:acetylornithine deacetylase
MDALELARRLVDIPSVTGDEAAVSRWLGEHLRDLGYRVELIPGVPGRPNLLATTQAPPRVVFSTHLDTVPPHVPARVADGYLYGRGSCDAKGIAAAQIAAAERLRAGGEQRIGLLFVVDEETGGEGAKAANGSPRAVECRYLVNGEPTQNRLARGCKGSLRPRRPRFTSCSTCCATCRPRPGRGIPCSAPRHAMSARSAAAKR